jgi:hypothetical protein
MKSAVQISSLLVLLVCLTSCGDDATAPGRTSGRPVIRGVTLVDWSAGGYRRPEAAEMLRSIATTGATHLAILVTAYQKTASSSTIHTDPLRTPDLDAVRQIAIQARALGMEVTIKAHVDVDDGTWRAAIEPDNPREWFDSYRAFLLPLASLTDSLGGSIFMIGTELAGTVQHAGLWRELITAVRAIYRGQLMYAASWDEAMLVPFWHDVDIVGIDCYVPVTIRDNPGRVEILTGWAAVLERYELLHRQTGRPVMLSEIGYRSIDGAGRRPYEWNVAGTIDIQEQADLYWAASQAMDATPWITGVYWWGWSADGSGGMEDGGYTPYGKPAEQVLQQHWLK